MKLRNYIIIVSLAIAILLFPETAGILIFTLLITNVLYFLIAAIIFRSAVALYYYIFPNGECWYYETLTIWVDRFLEKFGGILVDYDPKAREKYEKSNIKKAADPKNQHGKTTKGTAEHDLTEKPPKPKRSSKSDKNKPKRDGHSTPTTTTLMHGVKLPSDRK